MSRKPSHPIPSPASICCWMMVTATGVSSFYPPVFWSGFLQIPLLTFSWLVLVVLAAIFEAVVEVTPRPTSKLPSNEAREYKSPWAPAGMGCSLAEEARHLILIVFLAVELVERIALHIPQTEALVEEDQIITVAVMQVMEDLMAVTAETDMRAVEALVEVVGKDVLPENSRIQEQICILAVAVDAT